MNQPISEEAVAERVRQDRAQMYADQEPVVAPLTIEEAGARAIKYNLDYRLKLMEQALQQGIYDVTTFDMLPALTAHAGYAWRDRDLYSQYQTRGTPYDPNLPYSRSTENARRITGAELSWNLLDFGVAYYRAKAQSDQVLLAEERKRKVVQNLMQDVRNAYWRALGAQRLAERIDRLLARSDLALTRAREIEKQGLIPVPQALSYQRTLLDAITQLQSRRQDLELSRAELAALMNLPPAARFSLSDLAEADLPAPPTAIGELEDIALISRPELREEDYRKRISATETRRALASTLPNLSFDIGPQYDSNKFLLNNTWVEGGIRLSVNLLRLAAIPAIQRQGQAQQQVDDARRMAQAMAVLTQVRVAAMRYGLARSEYETHVASAGVDERLAGYARASASSQVESELEVIRTEARAVLSEYQRHIAYSNAQAAWGRLYNSLGLDIDASDSRLPVRALAVQIRHSLLKWQARTFETVAVGAIDAIPVALRIDGVADPAERAAATTAFARALHRQSIRLVDGSGDAIWTLAAHRSVEPGGGAGGSAGSSIGNDAGRAAGPATGTDRVAWTITLVRPNGSTAGRTVHASTMATSAPTATVAAMTEAAATVHADAVADWLEQERRRVLVQR
ncbi:MAG: TolC family protein [Lautropia sp.]